MEEKNNHFLLEIGTAPYLLKSMQKDKLKKVDIKEDWICLVSIHLDFLHNRGYFVFTDRKTTAKISFIQLLFREFHRTFGLQFLND